MENILKIFVRDIKNLVSHFFPLVIAIGVCILPSLYAWFNIYSNWDPYANTSNIKIAVANLDEGYTLEDGTKTNIGENVVEGLKDNKKIGWVFLDSKEEAINGVKKGDYYAAVVINEDFSTVVYNVLKQDIKNPTITYYENEKKNAVATKITDTAVGTLKTNINSQLISVAATAILEETNVVSEDLSDSTKMQQFIDSLQKVDDNLISYNKMIDGILRADKTLSKNISEANDKLPGLSAGISNTAGSISNAQYSLSSTTATLDSFGNQVESSMNNIEASLDRMAADLDNAELAAHAGNTVAAIDTTRKDTNELILQLEQIDEAILDYIYAQAGTEDSLPQLPEGTLDGLADSETQNSDNGQLDDKDISTIIPDLDKDIIANIPSDMPSIDDMTVDDLIKYTGMDPELAKQLLDSRETIKLLLDQAVAISKMLDAAITENASQAAVDIVNNNVNVAIDTISSCSSSVENMRMVFADSLVPQLKTVLGNLSASLGSAVNMLNDIERMVNNMSGVLTGVNSTVSSIDGTLVQIQAVLTDVSNQFTKVIDKLNSVSEDERYTTLLELLSGDPEAYGEFFAEPVTVNTIEVYPVKNYGSAVAPFYTVLALWVGAIILVAIIKVKPEDADLEDCKPRHLFFGRFLTFWLLGQLQTIIVVLGNMYLLHCQIEYPWLYFVTASITSATFNLLIYSLTLSFGDIGKAFAVVIMVIQIAGSGGTYPIEILPEFYQRVYIFFPFPYAINAFRETIAGMYDITYIKSMAQLLIFAIAAILLGLVIRLPFIGINHFVEKRMEDTKMM